MRVRSTYGFCGGGVAGRNGPAEMGSGGRARGHSEGRDFFPLTKKGDGLFREGVSEE
jgi:hypothetical protein